MNTDDLIHHYLDGSASDAEMEELSRLIETDAITRDRYLALADLHAALSADESLRQVRSIKTPPVAQWSVPAMWLKAAAALALLASVAWWASPEAKMKPPMAKLISSMNAQWGDQNTALTLNAGDEPNDVLRLVDGKAEFVTEHGATVTLEGRTVMRFENATSIFVESGKVVCSCSTPESRITVRTPQTQVVDLGTEFAVEARADKSTRVAVLSGEVRLGEDVSARVLHQGEAAEVCSRGVTMLHTEVVEEMMPRLPGAASASMSLANRLQNASFDSSRAWRKMDGHVWLADGCMRISSNGHRYWPFSQQSIWDKSLPGRLVTASVRAKQPGDDPLLSMQFAVLKIVFQGTNGKTLAYASRHFLFGGEAAEVYQKATITAAAPVGTKGVSLELLLNARGEHYGSVIFDDAVLSISPLAVTQ